MSQQTLTGKLLNAVTVVGVGPEISGIGPVALGSFAAEWTGSPTRVVVTIKGIIDGSTYDTLVVIDSDQGYTSGEIVFMSFPTMVRRVKASLDVLTGGSSPTVSCYMSTRD